MNKSAFSLIELSIVIMIMSLIITVVIGGRSLITQSRISRLTTEIHDIKQALATFELTYDALAGDFDNAYNLFADQGCGDDSSSGLSTSEKQAACNGDGDNNIEDNGITISSLAGSSNGFFREEHNVWNHLHYSNIMHLSSSSTNYFAAKSFTDLTISYGSHDLSNNPEFKRPKNVLFIGSLRTDLISTDITQTYALPASIISPRIAEKLDTKLDDSVAFSGSMQGFGGYDDLGNASTNCSTPITNYNSSNNTDYILSHDDDECVLMIDVYTVN
ncbi:MAG: type II secretion system protein [Rickettsiales bacterium]|jgi:prepilin-type N-terminal cleavage/methylation domain-containing protein|nr:type II secretion system protein [Rickettsiales bacterium]